MTDEIALSLTPEQYRSHETGAKWLFGACKTLPEERLVKWASVVVVAAYLATLGVITGHCWPTYRLWQVYPYPGGKRHDWLNKERRRGAVPNFDADDCSQNRAKYYALVTTNVLKLIFGLMFCAGFFIIICTLLRCIICLQTPERLDLGLSWSIRETVIGIICTNAPSIKPLFHRRNKSGTTNSSNPTGLVTFGGTGGSHKMSRLQRIPDEAGVGSQECIIDSVGGKNQTVAYADDRSSDHTTRYGNNIHVSREYRVDDHSS
ncbi:hypothetical protein ACJ41O_013125 [Fusarium nematophilum]